MIVFKSTPMLARCGGLASRRSLKIWQRKILRGIHGSSVPLLDDIHEFFAEFVTAEFSRRVTFPPKLLSQFE
jgi:hypothetical protein